MRRAARLLPALLVLAGCGGAPPPAHRAAPSPCPTKISAVAGHARLVSRAGDISTCAYSGGAGRFRVTVDTAPQAWVRWQRAQIERTQTTREWANIPAQQPRPVPGVGGGAFWVRATRELVTSDGRELLTVRVLQAPDPRTAAIRVARAGLGPVRLPSS
jgi:hypothetical protein